MSLAILEARVAALEARLALVEARSANGTTSSASSGAVADDRELDGKFGDPTVRKDPKRWLASGGASCVGLAFSECPPEFLDELASFNEWAADKDERELPPDSDRRKYIAYNRKDAARARGWAARIRAGKVTQKPRAPMVAASFNEVAVFDDEDGIPF